MKLLDMVALVDIGIFYEDTDWKDKIFETLSREAGECKLISRIDKNHICFRDAHINIIITFCPVNNLTSRKFDKIYYQKDIERYVVQSQIRPLLIPKILPLYEER